MPRRKPDLPPPPVPVGLPRKGRAVPKLGDPVFLALLKHHGLPQPVPEYVFAAPRKWRFDYAWLEPPFYDLTYGEWAPRRNVALEVQGGIWIQGGGRHQRGAALLKEHEKLSRAACLGWRILYRTPQNLCSQETVDLLREALGL